MKRDFLESKPIYYWLWLSDRQMDTLMHEDRWKDERIVGGRRERSEEPNGDMYDEPAEPRQKGGRKWCMLEVRQEHFPRLVASIWGIGLHTHTQYLHKETEIGLLIASRQTDLKGQQRSLYRGTCLVTVTANRKTIGDLNSRVIKSYKKKVQIRVSHILFSLHFYWSLIVEC